MIRLWHHRLMQCLIVLACMLALTNCLLWATDSNAWAFFYGACWTHNAFAALEKRRRRRHIAAMRRHLQILMALWLRGRPRIGP